jgi:hypothetical protein
MSENDTRPSPERGEKRGDEAAAGTQVPSDEPRDDRDAVPDLQGSRGAGSTAAPGPQAATPRPSPASDA